MKRLLVILVAVVALAACTPEQQILWADLTAPYGRAGRNRVRQLDLGDCVL